jgi:hypothetical protein
MLRRGNRRALLLAMLALPFGLAAQDAVVGLVKTVSGQVEVLRRGERLRGVVGLALQQGDQIVCGPSSGAGLVLADDSRVTLGPRSRLELADIQFDPVTHDGRVWLRLVNGALHLSTGHVARRAPQNVRVQTPTAVLGVRGTSFIVDTPQAEP